MKPTRFFNFKITNEHIPVDDEKLVEMYTQLHFDVLKKKEDFEKKVTNQNENDYLSLVVSRLAYVFTKEKHETLREEAEKRGLITNVLM